MTWGSHGLGLLALGFALTELAACGAGVAGVAASAGGGSGSGNSPPVLTAFEVLGAKVSPATLRLVVSDPEGDPLQAELFFTAGGNAEASLSALAGVTGNRVLLPSSSAGTETLLAWKFETELGGLGFVPSVELAVKQRGGATIRGGTLTVGMGNDPPVVTSVVPEPSDPEDASESAGIVELLLDVEDSSSDVVTLSMQWRRASDPPDAWQGATAAGVFPGGIETDPDGVELSFFWNTNIDLRDGDAEVLLRATPDDRTSGNGLGAPRESQPFRIDNNDEPILQLITELFVTGLDERRGIPVPFRVTDEEGDVVELVFQWTRPEVPFPELPTGTAELDAILADPALRRAHHICTAYPRQAHGLVVPVDETTVRLPELAQGESWALAWELEGRTLELLRPASIPAPISTSWPANPLVAPVAALPLGDGLTAVVVDGVVSPRVREIELATGRVVREIAQLGPGTPTAAALERGEGAVLIASDLGGTWRLERVELAGGAVTQLFISDAAGPPPPVRGITSLGRNAALVTVEARLARVDYRDPLAPRIATVVDGLATPWGVVLDPLNEGQAYVAERDAAGSSGVAGRILAVDLDSRGRVPVVVKPGPVVLEHPESLALERGGPRILVLTNPPAGKQLVGLDLGGRTGNVPFALGAPIEGETASLSSGADGLIVEALPGTNELLVGGGIEQRRTIVGSVQAAQRVSVGVPFAPPPTSGQPWRIALAPRVSAGQQGVERSFAWDASADLQSGGSAILRALARDSEAGLVVEGRVPKRIRTVLEVGPFVVSSGQTVEVTPADLDGDGDLDLTAASFQAVNVYVYSQTAFVFTSPLSFASPTLLGDASTILNPTSVRAADLDGDGDLDLVTSTGRQRLSALVVFFQNSPGSFDAPVLLESPDMVFSDAVRAADLDQDGELDLVSANRLSNNLTAYLQTGPRTFASDPIVLDLPHLDSQRWVAAADLDGDGDTDLSADERIFFQSSPGVFGTPVVLAGQFASGPVTAADLDADGDADVVQGKDLFIQTSPGEFGPAFALSTAGDSVQAADIDADGDLDLVTSVGILVQEAPAVFATEPIVVHTSNSATAADVDGDGDLDLISGLRIFLQGGQGSFLAIPESPPSGAFLSGFRLLAADLDANGALDLAGLRAILFQSAPGIFDSNPVIVDPSFSPLQAAVDLDGDGNLDLASTDEDNDDLKIFLQEGPGSFDPEPLLLNVPGEAPLGSSSPGSNPTFLASGDLDGDDDFDLVSANWGSDDLTVFFQDAPGSFEPAPLVLDVPGGATTGSFAGSNPASIAIADLDGDGDRDLASSNLLGSSAATSPGAELTIFFQRAAGTFDIEPYALDVPNIGSAPARSQSIAVSDLNGDGALDLVCANNGSSLGDGNGNLTIYFQTAPGVFDPIPRVLSGMEPVEVVSADVDGDGDQDLVCSFYDGGFAGDILVFRQAVPGAFDPLPLRLGTSSFAWGVLARDIDADGDVDLATVSFASSVRVFWGGR